MTAVRETEDVPTVDSKRRKPQRASAVNAVEMIFEASARILQTDGRAGLNTNRIARQAGVSIGSLYAYFPNKDAILLAMARRELVLLRESVMASLQREGDDSPPLRAVIRALIAGYSARDQARRLLMEALVAGGHSDQIRETIEVVTAVLARDGRGLFPSPPSPIGLFILTRAVDSVVRLATYEKAVFLHEREFEDDLVCLVEGYFLRREIGDPASVKAAHPSA